MNANINSKIDTDLVTDEDPHQRMRKVPMEVLSCGFSRTGTMTMRAAFEILGIPTWHNVTQSANPPDLDMWSEGLLAKFDPDKAAAQGIKPFGRKEFDNLLGHWGACTDQPAAIFCEELLSAYPDAKVVLVERDEDKWYKSFCATVVDSTFNDFIPIARHIDPVFMKRMTDQVDIIMKYYFNVTISRQKLFTNNPESKQMYMANARAMYRRHNEMVKRVTPPEKLLLFQLGDGWEPLCKFLGKPIPDVPFPWLNETEEVRKLAERYILASYKRSLWKLAKRLVVLGLVTGALWTVFRR